MAKTTVNGKSTSKKTKEENNKSKQKKTKGAKGSKKTEQVEARDVHMYVLLDRSGSMDSIADDVIGGFNRLIDDQRADGADAVVTLVQFDDGDPQEVIADAVPIAAVQPLSRATFVPRGCTPLLDATGRLLARAARREEARRAEGLADELVMFVSITDGHENASREFTSPVVRQLIDAHTEAGWTFVFLSAGLDVYGEALNLGYDPGAVQSFVADEDGAELAFDSLSASTRAFRSAARACPSMGRPDGDFFEDKGAEADRLERKGG